MDQAMSQGTGNDLVSVWLRRSLLDANDDILDAPLPDELVELAARLSGFC